MSVTNKFLGDWDHIACQEGTNKSSEDHGYMLFYEALLSHLNVRRALEFGIHEGASIRTWRRIWPDAEIVGVDINAFMPIDGATLIRADATDATFADDCVELHGQFDVIIDDASHQPKDIAAALDIFAPRLAPNGVYIVEDTLWDDPNADPWYARTSDVMEHVRSLGYAPMVLTPGCRFDRHGNEPIPDRGPWAMVWFTNPGVW